MPRSSLPLLQGIFLTQASNRCLLHCRQILYHWATWKAFLCFGSVSDAYGHLKFFLSVHFSYTLGCDFLYLPTRRSADLTESCVLTKPLQGGLLPPSASLTRKAILWFRFGSRWKGRTVFGERRIWITLFISLCSQPINREHWLSQFETWAGSLGQTQETGRRQALDQSLLETEIRTPATPRKQRKIAFLVSFWKGWKMYLWCLPAKANFWSLCCWPWAAKCQRSEGDVLVWFLNDHHGLVKNSWFCDAVSCRHLFCF